MRFIIAIILVLITGNTVCSDTASDPKLPKEKTHIQMGILRKFVVDCTVLKIKHVPGTSGKWITLKAKGKKNPLDFHTDSDHKFYTGEKITLLIHGILLPKGEGSVPFGDNSIEVIRIQFGKRRGEDGIITK